jgi:WD40 repeat protein/uncharacterized caspase-like protein
MRISLLLLLLFFCILASAQQSTQIVLQQGHSNFVTSLVPFRNDQYLASAAWDNVIKIWDLRSGLLFKTLTGHTGNIECLALSSDKSLLMSGGADSKLRFWDVTTLTEKFSVKLEGGSINVITLCNDGKSMVVATSNNVYFLDQKTGKVLRKNFYSNIKALVVHPKTDAVYQAFYSSSIYKENLYQTSLTKDSVWRQWEIAEKFPKGLAISPDGSTLVAGGSGVMHVFSTITQEKREFAFSKGGTSRIEFISDTLLGVTAGLGYYVLNLKGEIRQSFFSLQTQSAALSQDKRYVFIGNQDGTILMIDRNTEQLVRRFKGGDNYIQALKFASKGNLFIAQNGELNAWQLASLKNERKLNATTLKVQNTFRFDYSTNYNCEQFYFSKEGEVLLAGKESKQAFDLKSSSVIAMPAGSTPIAVSGDGNRLLLKTAEGNKLYDWKKDSSSNTIITAKTGILNSTGTNFLEATPEKSYALYDLKLNSAPKKIKSIPLDIGGYTYTLGGFGVELFSRNDKHLLTFGDQQAIVFDLAAGKEIKKLEGHDGRILSADYNKDNTLIATGDSKKVIKIWETTTFRNTLTLKGHDESIEALSFANDKNILASGSDDGVVKFWNASTGKEIATLISDSDDNYIFITPDNYYATNKNGQKMVAFRVGDKLFPFEQFDLQYNRPDIVLSRLGYASQDLINSYKKAYDKRLKKMGFSPEKFGKELHAPQIEILNKSTLVARSDKAVLNLELSASDALYKLERLQVTVNDVPVYGTRGKEFSAAPLVKKTITEELFLNKGLNKISVSVINEKGSSSLAETVFIEYMPAQPSKHNLYLISIGTSQYKNTQYNLQYASKDATDLSALFASKKDEYNQVVMEKITDENCTLENIQALKSKLMTTSVDDEVIVFIAGHGVLDQDLNYYLATHDMDFAAPVGRGLSYEKLEELLDGIPARKKLLLMDACHSGEVDKEEMQLQAATTKVEEGEISFRNAGPAIKHIGLENSFDMMRQLFTDLRKGNGTTVISSAGGGEYAMEGAAWKNGVFTYCLLSGLKDQKADKNKDGKIMLSELQEYLQAQVSSLTGGKQKPTSRVENISNDWRVW